MPTPFSANEAQSVGNVAKAAMAMPLKCFAEAWGLNDGARGAGGSGSASTPLEGGLGSIAKMSYSDMQAQLDAGLKQDIYNV